MTVDVNDYIRHVKPLINDPMLGKLNENKNIKELFRYIYGELQDKAEELIPKAINDKINDPCKTSYLASSRPSPELAIWSLGLICEAWTLELLRQKTQNGHCHNNTHPKPCSQGSDFHKKLFNEVKESFQDVIANIKIS